MSVADVDARPLREIYLRGFQRVVEDAQPWTVMCSYNRINGVYASEDPWLLTTVLRDEWGFEGLVVSDWGAVEERVAALAAGLDLEMPGSIGVPTPTVVAAVEEGSLDEKCRGRRGRPCRSTWCCRSQPSAERREPAARRRRAPRTRSRGGRPLDRAAEERRRCSCRLAKRCEHRGDRRLRRQNRATRAPARR